MQRILLPPSCRGLGELAEATGSLEALLPRDPCPPSDQFIRRGETRAAGHFFYGPRFALPAGGYLIWYWLRVRRDAAASRLIFDAVAWDGDASRSLGRHVAALRSGEARFIIYPLWIETEGSDAIELRGWSDTNSADFRAIGVAVHRITASSAAPPWPAGFRMPWRRRPKTEAIVNVRSDFAELWLAFDPHRAGAAQFTLSKDRQPGAIIEFPDPAAAAPFALADGRLLLSLGLPAASAAGHRATISLGGRAIHLSTSEISQASPGAVANWKRPELLVLDSEFSSLEEPSPRSIEVIAREAQVATNVERDVAIMELWSDFPLVPAERDRMVVAGRFLWDAAGLRLRHGFGRFPAGRFPALRLACGPAGGSCTIRHRNRDIELDLHAPEPSFLLVFPTLAEPVLRAQPGQSAADAIHPALQHMFRRLRGSWIDGAAAAFGDADVVVDAATRWH